MLIGMHGKARSGKDTALRFIREEYGANTPVIGKSFARLMKESAAATLGYKGDNPIEFCNLLKEEGRVVILLGETNPGWKLTGREYLQRYGTEAHREIFDTDFWVDACLPKGTLHDGSILVATDVRFSNEAIRIQRLGGEVWHVIRPSVENGDTHASEQVLPPELIDVTIHNDGTLDEYREDIIELVEMSKEGVRTTGSVLDSGRGK